MPSQKICNRFRLNIDESTITNLRNKNAIKQTKPLRENGFKASKLRQEKTTVYHFKKGNIFVKIIPDMAYDISFDGGVSFEKITDSSIGTSEERDELGELIDKYNACDYRDEDLYEPTPAFVKFLVKYI